MIPLGITEENTLQEEKLNKPNVRVTDLFILLPSARNQQDWNTQKSTANKPWTNRQNNDIVQNPFTGFGLPQCLEKHLESQFDQQQQQKQLLNWAFFVVLFP